MIDLDFRRRKKYTKTTEEHWYRRLWGRLISWFKTRRNKKQQQHQHCGKDVTGDHLHLSRNTALFNKVASASRSLDDIPRRPIGDDNKDKETEEVSELSPIVNEPWKDDSKLMISGQYMRMKTVCGKFTMKYRLKSIIGQGSFGFVLRAERLRDTLSVAVKFIYRPNINTSNWLFDGELGMIPSEVFYLKKLRHAGIVQFLDYFDDGRYIYLVTELHGTSWSSAKNPDLSPEKNPGLRSIPTTHSATDDTGGRPCDLFECIEAHTYLPERTIHYIFMQLLDVFKYLKQQGIVHRDLKDENVVVDSEYRIKIIDFGCAARIPISASGNGEGEEEEGYFEKFNGTLAFAPPEVIRGLKYKGSEAECWTLGVLLFTMAFRQAPFPDSESILKGQLEFPFEEDRPGKTIICVCESFILFYFRNSGFDS